MAAGTPILLTALGELITERSGVINLGLEGLMLVGALSGFMVSHYTGNPYLGLLVAGIAASILSGIHAFIVVTLDCNQVVSGLAIAILGSGVSSFFGQKMIGQTAKGFQSFLLNLNWMVFLGIGLTAILWIMLRYTKPGLDLIAVGYDPLVSSAAGLNVKQVRYVATLFGGFMAGIGGAYLSLAYNQMWIENMVAGRGWIAIALVIFSMWNPIRTLLGAYLFGMIISISLRAQALGVQIPVYILNMSPYVATIIVLIFMNLYERRQAFKAKTPKKKGEVSNTLFEL